ncbi:MAG TPA: GGDEF domain-containing protein [Polyangiaceae bacterium]|nr:GGDEF domain-containing protein [Polyangiaceae bacterium]
MASIFPGRRTAISIPSERPAAAGPPCLVIISGDEIGRRFELSKQEVSIGRADTCTICVNTDQVSRRHATVQHVLGRYYIVDLRSTNGTFVNEQKVDRAKLVDGDQIRVGKTVIKYTESHVEQRYFEHAFNMASMDALTGAFNKRYFDETFGKEVLRAQQTRSPLSIVIFDIDHFKKINDAFGHPAGDAVLKNVSSAVSAQLREGDGLFRVGGEEFVLLLSATPKDMAVQAAEAVRGLIEALVTDVPGTRIPATLSLGVAQLREGEQPAALYQRADERLYAAKRGGRNRVIA